MLSRGSRRNRFERTVHLFTSCRAHISHPERVYLACLEQPRARTSSTASAFTESYDQSPMETSTSQSGQ